MGVFVLFWGRGIGWVAGCMSVWFLGEAPGIETMEGGSSCRCSSPKRVSAIGSLSIT